MAYSYTDYLNELGIYTFPDAPETERSITVKQSGMSCVQCREFNDYAEPNQPDGKTHVCYSCRESYKWKYGERYNCSRKAGRADRVR